MSQRKHHPGSFQQQYWRASERSNPNLNKDTDPANFKSDPSEPDCMIFVTKRRGFGSTGNKESSPMSPRGAAYLAKSFPSDSFVRYQVNVYLKSKGSSDARRQSRGW